MDKGLIKSGTIIVDSTHTNAAVRAKSPTQILRDMSKQLRKEIYKSAYELSEKFPEKPSLEAGLDEEITYTKNLSIFWHKEYLPAFRQHFFLKFIVRK